MPVPAKKLLSDLKTARESSFKNDFHHYWNGGIPETIASAIAEDAPDASLKKDELNVAVNTDSYSILNIKNLLT